MPSQKKATGKKGVKNAAAGNTHFDAAIGNIQMKISMPFWLNSTPPIKRKLLRPKLKKEKEQIKEK